MGKFRIVGSLSMEKEEMKKDISDRFMRSRWARNSDY